MFYTKQVRATVLTLLLLCGLPTLCLARDFDGQGSQQISQSSGHKTIQLSKVELQALGAQTIEDSLNVLKELTQHQSANASEFLYKDLTTLPNTPHFEDLIFVEISSDGKRLYYHFENSIEKDGLRASITFELSDQRQLSKANPVIQSALKRPIRRQNANQSVHVIDAEEIQALQLQSVAEVLNTLSDLSVKNAGGQLSLFYQGQHSGSVKVLYNGVDLGDASGINGAPYLNSIPLNTIERIEILSGASSSLHGSHAMGAVINIIANPSSKSSFFKSVVGQDFLQHDLSFKEHIGNAQIAFVHHRLFDNRLSVKNTNSERDHLMKEISGIYFNRAFSPSHHLKGFVSHFKIKQDLDYFSWLENYPRDQFTKEEGFLFGLDNVFQWQPFGSSQLAYGQNNLTRYYLNQGKDESKYRSLKHQFSYSESFTLSSQHQSLIGFDYHKDKAETTWQQSTYQERYAGFVQHRFTQRFFTTDLAYRLEKNDAIKHRQAGTYDLALFKKIPVLETKISLSQKTAYRAPSLYEIFNADQNIDLREEQQLRRELRLDKQFGAIHVDFTFFDAFLKNKLAYNNQSFNYFNSGDDKQYGNSLGLALFDLGPIRLFKVTHTRTHARTGQKRSLNVPLNKSHLILILNQGRFEWGGHLLHESQRYAYGGQELAAYLRLDLSCRFSLKNKTQLLAKLENVLNTDYETAYGYSTPGASVFVGINHEF